ncbi:MAG: hypothetical protein ONA90_08745 [candidate division KSB1 bacterium]|nr:hypothetical protein [candidate division KSB1 bacterium]
MNQKGILLLAILSTLSFSLAHGAELDSLVAGARRLYYASVNDKTQIDPAIAMFTKISHADEAWRGRALTYIGSLIALKAKFAFWPNEKWDLAKMGLRLMDEGVAHDTDDVEALFIHGATCFYLPIFFGRADDAQNQLRRIVQLLPERMHQYDSALVVNVIQFLFENLRLSRAERQRLNELKNISLVQK